MEPQVQENPQFQVLDPVGPTGIDAVLATTVRDVKELNIQIKTKQKELKERLNLNATYASVDDEYKGVAKVRRDTKLKVVASDEAMAKLDADLKSLKGEKKELENKLSDELIEFSSQTGQLSFIDDEGNVVEFEKVAKLRIISQ